MSFFLHAPYFFLGREGGGGKKFCPQVGITLSLPLLLETPDCLPNQTSLGWVPVALEEQGQVLQLHRLLLAQPPLNVSTDGGPEEMVRWEMEDEHVQPARSRTTERVKRKRTPSRRTTLSRKVTIQRCSCWPT